MLTANQPAESMPKGPWGERRAADVIGTAVRVIRIVTGEEPDDREDAPMPKPAQQLGKLGKLGKLGGDRGITPGGCRVRQVVRRSG
jgi:hypothetical protein